MHELNDEDIYLKGFYYAGYHSCFSSLSTDDNKQIIIFTGNGTEVIIDLPQNKLIINES